MVSDEHGEFPVWQVDVDMKRGYVEIVEHASVLVQRRSIARVIPERYRPSIAHNRCAASTQPKTFRCRGHRDCGAQPDQLLQELRAIFAWRCFQLNLALAEFAGDAVTQSLRGPRDDFLAALSGKPCCGIDEELLLLDPDGRRHTCGHRR